MKTTWMLFIINLILISTPVLAFERYEFYNGARQMGMGGVVVPTVNDETALLSNPAALGKLRNSYLTVVDPELAGSSNNVGIMNKGGGSSIAFTEPQDLLNKLNASPNTHFNALGQAFPSLVTTNFGIGFHGKYRYDGEVDTSIDKFRYHYLNDVGVVMGFNLRIWEGRIKIGLGGRLIDRVEADYESDADALSTSSTNLQLKDLVREGVGFAGDAGVILTAPWTWLPSVAGVLRDAGGTSYDMNEGFQYKNTLRPNLTPQTVDVGVSVSPILSNRVRAQIGVEYRDVLTSNDETDQFRRTHLGVELNLGDVLFLRGGMNQRYWTAGCELSMYMLQIQFATYGEQIGTATAPREDRRYMGKVSLRF